MHIVFDIILVALFAFFLLRGYFKGFLKMILSLGRLILSAVITVIFGGAFAGWIDQKFVNPPVFNAVHDKVVELAGDTITNVESFVDELPAAIKNFVDAETLANKYGDANVSVNTMINDISVTVSNSISIVISTIVGYALLFVLSFVILTVAIFLIGRFVKNSPFKKGDKLLGLAVGAVSGLIVVALVSIVMYLIIYALGDLSAYENSVVFKFTKDINIFGFILDKLIG